MSVLEELAEELEDMLYEQMSVQKALGTVLGVEGARMEEDSSSSKSMNMQPEEEMKGLERKILHAPIWGSRVEDRRQIAMRILDQEATGKEASYKVCLSCGTPLHVDSPLYCLLAPKSSLQGKNEQPTPPSSTPLDHMGDMDGTSAWPDLNLEGTELPLTSKSHSPTVEDPIEEGKEVYVNPFEEEDLCKAFSDWKKALADLLDLPRRNPPGKLSLSNLERLVKEQYIHHELLLE